MATVVAAGKTPHSHDPDLLRVSIAPDPRDIIWENAHVNDSFNRGREFTVSILFALSTLKWYVGIVYLISAPTLKANVFIGLGAILWSTVVASIQAWATIDKISTVPGFHWMNSINVNQKFSSFVNGYLPVVALLVIISVLPLIFETIAQKFENRKTKSDIQNSMLGRYFYYQVRSHQMTRASNDTVTQLFYLLAGQYLRHGYSRFNLDFPEHYSRPSWIHFRNSWEKHS